MRRKGVMSLLGIALIVCMMNLVAFAASSPLSASQEKSFVFAVPEGGWSSATVSVNYAEYFTTKGSSSTFNKRVKSMCAKRSYATSIPVISLDQVTHSSGSTFTSWKSNSVIYDGVKWDCASNYVNTTSVTYSTTTSNTGTLSYCVYCSGALVPTQASSVTLSLRTK